jgi:hypothetical protein
MALEHRWSPRQQVRWQGFVLHRLTGLVAIHVLDISREGAFIAARYLELPRMAGVELSFATTLADKPLIHHLHAYVIHRTSGGYGLLFKDFRFTVPPAAAGMPRVA